MQKLVLQFQNLHFRNYIFKLKDKYEKIMETYPTLENYKEFIKDNIVDNGCVSVPLCSIVEIEPEPKKQPETKGTLIEELEKQ